MPIETASQKDSATGVTPAAPWRVKAITVMPGYRLAVTFQDGMSGIVDMSGLVSAKNAGIYAKLADHAMFDQASIDVGVVTWPNGADLDPAWMHEQIERERTWVVPF
jgi:hypothetical protein